MPQYIVDSDIQAVFPTELNTQPFIEAAIVVMDALLSTASYNAMTLREIQRWLAVYFASVADQRVQRESYEGLDVTYWTPKLGEGLAASPYGSILRALDTENLLGPQLGGKIARFSVH